MNALRTHCVDWSTEMCACVWVAVFRFLSLFHSIFFTCYSFQCLIILNYANWTSYVYEYKIIQKWSVRILVFLGNCIVALLKVVRSAPSRVLLWTKTRLQRTWSNKMVRNILGNLIRKVYLHSQKHFGLFNHVLGCLSCVSVTKECYQIGFLESSLRSSFSSIS